MSKKIVGVTVGTTISPKLLDKKLKPVKTVNGVEPDENGNATLTAEKIGARPDTWMPSESDVGAAPAGYGLNNDFTTATTPAKIDEFKSSGWYRYVASGGASLVAGWDILYAGIRVDSYSTSGIIIQTIYPIAPLQGCLLRRYFVNNAWSEFEWINPPMVLGVEYRTTKRHNGKAVYVKLLDVGAIPNKTYKDISIGATITALVDLKVTISDGSTFKILPVYDQDVSAHVVWAGAVRVYSTTNDMSAYTGEIYIEYTKD